MGQKSQDIINLCCSSAVQSCLTLCDHMDCSTPGLPFLTISRSLPKFTSISAISFSNALFFCPQSFTASGTFPMSYLFTSDDQNTEASASVLPVNIQGWSLLWLTGLISLLSKGLSGVFSSTAIWRHQFFGFLPSYGPALHSHTWPLGKNHSLDYIDLCRQSNVSAFQHTV